MSEQGYHEHVVTPEEEGVRIDTLVGSLGVVPSRSAAARLIEDSLVTVDGDPVSKRYAVRAGDVVGIDVPPPVFSDLEPEYIPLDIRYEDDAMIVLSKQADLVVHPAHGNWSGTLVNGLLAHARELGSLQGEDRPGIVHRLDKDTSGLMMVAKTDDAQVRLQDDIRLRSVDRRYLALVHGWIAHDTGTIDAPIGRDPRDRLRMAVVDHAGSKSAITTFRVLERFEAGRFDDGFTLIECKLYTGRTHQIRVHMEYAEHPIVGDQTYGNRRPRSNLGLTRQFLHSYALNFEHPITGAKMSFVDPPPEDLAAALEQIREYSCGRTEAGREVFAALENEERE